MRCHFLIRWWLDELAQILPSRFRDHFALTFPEHASIQYLDSAGSSVQLAKSVASIGPAAEQLGLAWIDPQLLFVQSLTLPILAGKRLRRAVNAEVAQLSPFTSSTTCYHASLDGVEGARQRLKITLFVAHTRLIEDVIKSAAANGVLIYQLTTTNATRRVALAGFKLPGLQIGQKRYASIRRSRLQSAGGKILAICTLLSGPPLSLAYLVHQEQEHLTQVTAVAAELKQRSDAFLQDAERKNDLRTQYDLAIVPRAIVEVGYSLPDTVWLTHLGIRDGEVRLQGYSDRASKVIDAFRSSPLLEAPAFESPIMPTPDGKGDRFDVVIRIHPRFGQRSQ